MDRKGDTFKVMKFRVKGIIVEECDCWRCRVDDAVAKRNEEIMKEWDAALRGEEVSDDA